MRTLYILGCSAVLKYSEIHVSSAESLSLLLAVLESVSEWLSLLSESCLSSISSPMSYDRSVSLSYRDC